MRAGAPRRPLTAKMAMRRTLPACAIVALCLGAASMARATANFPGTVQSHLELEAVPACTLCHNSLAGGAGTVQQPVGVALVAEGLVAYDDNSLIAALDALEAAGSDVDGDGLTDIDELRSGTDPNVVTAAGDSTDQPIKYGFGCSHAGTAPLLLALVALLRRRRAGSRGQRASSTSRAP